MKLAPALLVFVFPVVMTAAGTIDGNWAGRAEADDRNDPPFQLFLTSEGEVLTGDVVNASGRFTIQNGTVSPDAIFFDAVQQGEGGVTELALSCNGAVAEAENHAESTISLTCQLAGGGQKTLVLKPHIGA